LKQQNPQEKPVNSKHPKGEGVIFPNNEKTEEKHPDHRGKIEVTRDQILRLVEMGKAGLTPTLQIGAWQRVSQAGNPYMYLSTEAYMKPVEAEGWEDPKRPASYNMDKLLPCPFCGDDKSIRVWDGASARLDGNTDPSGDQAACRVVVCDMTSEGCGATGGYRPTEEQAVVAWNTRVSMEKS
jgi:uncharacterized protein (DUF736 family)